MRINLRTKLVGAFTAVAVIASLAGVYQMNQLTTLHREYRHLTEITDAGSADTLALESLTAQKNAAIWAYYVFTNADYATEYRNLRTALQEKVATLQAYLPDAADRQVVAQLDELNKAYDKVATDALIMIGEGKRDAALVLLANTGEPLVKEIVPRARELRAKYVALAAREQKAVAQRADRAMYIGYASFAAALALALAAGFLLANAVVRPVQRLVAAARRLAAGDLTVEALQVRTGDEVADMAAAFGQMVGNLRQLLAGVEASTDAVLAATQSLGAAAEQSASGVGSAALVADNVARGAEEQHRAADEMARTMEELKQTIGQIAAGAGQTAAEVQQASELLSEMVAAIDSVAAGAGQVAAAAGQAAATARDGAAVVQRTAAGMGQAQQAVAESAERMRELERLSGQVGEITRAISEIAGQTSMLALNAAIEAARAGEHGRGFAVVADAVRQLADQSAGSAREIAALLGAIQSCTADAVKAMNRGLSEVAGGTALAGEAGRALDRIVAVAEGAAQQVGNIAEAAQSVRSSAGNVVKAFDSVAAVTEESTTAAEEMAAGANEVAAATGRVAEISQQNVSAAGSVSAAMAQLDGSAMQVAGAADELDRVAAELKAQVSRFKL